MKQRNAKKFSEAIRNAQTSEEQALAYYNLGLFHDNNSREAEAIPNYKKALKLGLDNKTKAEALAWLASSLYKTGNLKEALEKLEQSLKIANNEKLVSFLIGSKKRILKSKVG